MREDLAPLAWYAPEAFDAWLAHVREHRGWRHRDVARLFGVSLRTVTTWRAEGMPGHVGLACHALLKGMPAWHPTKEET